MARASAPLRLLSSMPVPAWLRRAVADAQSLAGKGVGLNVLGPNALEDIAIAAGAAIGAHRRFSHVFEFTNTKGNCVAAINSYGDAECKSGFKPEKEPD